MSDRLARALLANVADGSLAGGDPSLAWLLIEGVEPSLAKRLVELWPEQLPPIFVAGPQDVDFGAADLRDGSATRARNRGGMCLVVCEGERVPDGQSVVAFDRRGPETLLGSSGLLRLAAQEPSVAAEPGISVVAEALDDDKLESPPSARAVASFLDQVAAGESASDALPAIGGFREDLEPGSLTRARVVANLNLAASRSTAERLAPSSLSDIRERAERHLRNPEAAERVVELLLARDEALLSELKYRDASAVLERPPAAGLPQRVASEFAAFGESTPEAASDVARGLELGSHLENPEQRKEAAQELLDLDAQHQNGILSQDSRRRLKSQRRDRSVREKSLEAGLIRALDNLSSAVKSVDLRDPQPPAGQSGDAALKATITIAAAHVRIAPLLRRLEATHGVRVAAALLADPGPQLTGALAQLESKGAPTHRALKIAVRGVERGDTVEVNWMPAAEDIALLAATARLAAADPPTLSLRNSGLTTLTLTSLAASATPPALAALAGRARATAGAILRDGYSPGSLRSWVADWRQAVDEQRSEGNTGPTLDGLTLAGAVVGGTSQVALTGISPLKAEWLAQRTEAWWELIELAASATLGEPARSPGDTLPPPLVSTARALGAATASRYPGYVALSGREAPLLPASDASVFAVFGEGDLGAAVAELPLEPIQATIRKLIDLHPEAADNLRCVAWGDRACDLLARALLSDRSKAFQAAEIYCVEGRPAAETLADLDDRARADSGRTIQLRYIDDLAAWQAQHSGPITHLALLEGVTSARAPVRSNMEEIEAPPTEEDVLFTPRTWVRANRSRVLLAPPRMSTAGKAWHSLQTAVTESEWPSGAPRFRVPELRADATEAGGAIRRLHDLALWVAVIDRYATRDTIRQAAGGDIAILHQERRAAGDAVFGLVISQRSGGTADRAIARSLRASNLLDETAADGVAQGLREAASRGYGILALRAATTGSGINELIGHVAAFHRLTSDATPWPLPPGCRVLLISLDEYATWFGTGKRADMLALALSPEERGVHAANIEVKAVKDPGGAARSALVEAKEQLRKTLIDSRFAAYPNGSLFSRLWLNRIVEAAIGVCRENDLKLDGDDLVALDNFRLGDGVLEWAGVAMVFTPGAIEPPQHSHIPLMQDRVPIVQAMVPLTQDLLAAAAAGDGTQLRTVASGRSVLASSTKRRSFERAMQTPQELGDPTDLPGQAPSPLDDGGSAELVNDPAKEQAAAEEGGPAVDLRVITSEESPEPESPPILGWDAASGEPVEWRVTGAGALSNGHVEIYGTSGAGKTQFVMSLLAQLKSMGSHFGVCDFKNDYAADFPDRVGARFFDLWAESLPFNPLAIDDPSRRNLQALTIELRDAVDIAARAYARLGHRQLTKLQQAFEEAFEEARTAGRRAPTLSDVHELLDDDLRGVIGDLTGTDLFGDGPPLGSVVEHDVVFGLNRIPGTGMTTTLAAGFILAALYLKLLEMPQVANQVTYTMVIDEAHRVGHFHSVSSMVRELRSKGLAVILATQKPGDLPDEASTNAQTKIFLRLPDAQSARDAAKALDPLDRGLPELIRTLPSGDAFVGFAGAAPRLIRLKQFWRDH